MFVLQMKHKLNIVKSMRWSESDIELMNDLQKNSIDVHRFIRNAFRQKIEMDMPYILQNEKKKQSKQYCPF